MRRPSVRTSYALGSTVPKACPVMNALQKVVEEDRVCLSGVRPPKKNDFGILNFAVGVSYPHQPQTRSTGAGTNAGGVSRTVATVDVIASDHDPGELLRDVVHLVRGLGATEHPERLRTVPIEGRPYSRGGPIECLVPSRRTQRAAVTDQRLSQPGISLGPWCLDLIVHTHFPGKFGKIGQHALYANGGRTQGRSTPKRAIHDEIDFQNFQHEHITRSRNSQLSDRGSWSVQRVRSPTHGRRRHRSPA